MPTNKNQYFMHIHAGCCVFFLEVFLESFASVSAGFGGVAPELTSVPVDGLLSRESR